MDKGRRGVPRPHTGHFQKRPDLWEHVQFNILLNANRELVIIYHYVKWDINTLVTAHGSKCHMV